MVRTIVGVMARLLRYGSSRINSSKLKQTQAYASITRRRGATHPHPIVLLAGARMAAIVGRRLVDSDSEDAMANTFQDQANERFDKATAFLNSSRSLLRNDLIYVSALADAVSAIKNMLQGYLYTQIAQKSPGATPQSWQEAAVSGSMPDLLRASTEAGLR